MIVITLPAQPCARRPARAAPRAPPCARCPLRIPCARPRAFAHLSRIDLAGRIWQATARPAIGYKEQVRDSIVVSISACHAEDPGSIPGRGVFVVVVVPGVDVLHYQ